MHYYYTHNSLNLVYNIYLAGMKLLLRIHVISKVTKKVCSICLNNCMYTMYIHTLSYQELAAPPPVVGMCDWDRSWSSPLTQGTVDRDRDSQENTSHSHWAGHTEHPEVFNNEGDEISMYEARRVLGELNALMWTKFGIKVNRFDFSLYVIYL